MYDADQLIHSWLDFGGDLHHYADIGILTSVALCGLRGCKNRSAQFPGRMSYKATKPGSVCPVS